MLSLYEHQFLNPPCQQIGREPLPEVQARVCCRGSVHKIKHDLKGHIILCNHSQQDLKREQSWQELGGRRCRCLRIRESWPEAPHLPAPLLKVAQEAYMRGQCRRSRRQAHDRLARPLPERPQYACALVYRLLCENANVPATVAYFSHAQLVAQPELVWRYSLRLKTPEGDTFAFPVDDRWIDRVYRRGLAWLDNAVTMAIEWESHGKKRARYEVTQCRPVIKDARLRFVRERKEVIREFPSGKVVSCLSGQWFSKSCLHTSDCQCVPGLVIQTHSDQGLRLSRFQCGPGRPPSAV